MTPDAADAYYNLGHALTDCGNYEAAEEALSTCLSLSPTDADAYYDLWALRTEAADMNSWARNARYDAATYARGLQFFFPDRDRGAARIPSDGPPVAVRSAFGGLGILNAA